MIVLVAGMGLIQMLQVAINRLPCGFFFVCVLNSWDWLATAVKKEHQVSDLVLSRKATLESVLFVC